ncbi:DUF3108 domain-containing protein [Myxococcaceae bacterium GXIMD 01537]
MRTRFLSVTLSGLLMSGAALAEQPASAFGPGEQASYRVRYLGLPAGSAQITVGAPMTQWGESVWPIVATARSEAMLGVWPIKSKFVSYWENGGQRVLGSDLVSDENNKRRRQRIQLRDNGRFAHVTKQKESEAPRESQHELAEGTFDMAGATFALRNRPLEVGQEYTYPVFTGSKAFTMTAKVEARETVDTPLGEREAFRMRITTSFGGKLESKRDMKAWLTTDALHLPVRIEADFVLGSVVAEITDFKQGREMARAGTQGPSPTARR